jgi:nitrite reductase (NADH) small subunit
MNQAPHDANHVTLAALHMTHPHEGIFDLGSIEQIPPGQGRCFVANEIPIAVFRFRDGRVFAVDNRCPHRGGPLSEGVVGTDLSSGAAAVVCPLHAYKFSLADGRGLEADMQARVYRVEIRDARICVSFD